MNLVSTLLVKVYPTLIKAGKPGECASISIPDIYIKLTELKPNKKRTIS